MKRIMLDRLQDRFIGLLERYMQDRDLNQEGLANKVGIERSLINKLLNRKRRLSAYYVMLFIRSGVIRMHQLYDGKAESMAEEDFWQTAPELENYALLRKIARLRKAGIDVEYLLDMVDPDKKRK